MRPKSFDDEARNERIGIYLDCIIGAASAIISLVTMYISVQMYGIQRVGAFTFGLIFWVFWLIFSLTLIFIGIRGWYKIKKYGVVKTKKKLRAPIVG